MANQSKRDHIIFASYEVFKTQGFFATSMEDLIRAAKVSRRTMYNHFSSKEKLVENVIYHYANEYEANLNLYFKTKKSTEPIEKLRALFEYSLTWYRNKLFHGCMAVHAVSEFANKNSQIIQACQKFKDRQLEIITKLVKDAGLKKPKELAYELLIVMEGLTVVSSRSKSCPPESPSVLFDKVIKGH